MVPRKLVETAFDHVALLLLPIILAPLAVILLVTPVKEYESEAVVWVSAPPGETGGVGYHNPYLTPAANQVTALQDLLGTEAFRLDIAQRAGFLEGKTVEESQEIADRIVVAVYSSGVNLLHVVGRNPDPETALAITEATLAAFGERARNVSVQANKDDAAYYERQLGIAEQVLTERRSNLSAYIAAHPAVADPAVAELDLEYRSLKALVDGQDKTVSEITSRLQQAQLKLAADPDGTTAAFSIQDAPKTPSDPIPTSITKRLGLPLAAAVFGLMISAGLLFVRYRADHSIVSAEDLIGIEVPLLAVVPELRPQGRLARLPLVSALIALRRRGFARSVARSIGAPEEAKA